jgi:hypothetical protein
MGIKVIFHFDMIENIIITKTNYFHEQHYCFPITPQTSLAVLSQASPR